MNTGKEFCSTMNLGSQLVMLLDDYRFNGVTSEMEEFALPTGIAFSVQNLCVSVLPFRYRVIPLCKWRLTGCIFNSYFLKIISIS